MERYLYSMELRLDRLLSIYSLEELLEMLDTTPLDVLIYLHNHSIVDLDNLPTMNEDELLRTSDEE